MDKTKLLGIDLKVTETPMGIDLDLRQNKNKDIDLDLIDGTHNLVQALRLRLLCHKGELIKLGHPEYGSRIIEAIGEIQSPMNLKMLSHFIREVLLQEPRIKKIENLILHRSKDHPEVIAAEVSVLPIDEQVSLNLVINLV